MIAKDAPALVAQILARIAEIIPDEPRFLKFCEKAFPVIWNGVQNGYAFIISETPKGYQVLCVKDDAQKAKD